MENYYVLVGLLLFFFGGPAIWGVIHSILEHRKEMAEIEHKHERESRLLTAENDELKETIAHMQDRIAILETIATDPAKRTADEIEALR